MNKSDFRLILETTDGSLIVNRTADSSYYFLSTNRPDCEFIDYSLARECREKGVRLIKYTINDTHLKGIVDYC